MHCLTGAGIGSTLAWVRPLPTAVLSLLHRRAIVIAPEHISSVMDHRVNVADMESISILMFHNSLLGF